MTIELDCKTEPFIAKGTRTKIKGWHDLYGKHVMLKEEELPEVNKGDTVNVKKIISFIFHTLPYLTGIEIQFPLCSGKTLTTN